ncbi:MAG: 1-deoxy-D-xylulose-5-phosphate synthase [Treponema sp.]|nr:MAG: 1-deoxy-D-xylulose-5-phosphate synthase [Treponema sp.]
MSEKLLERIQSPDDLKSLTNAEVKMLASEIRLKILNTVANNGGHLASNLGVVELTLALHRVFSTPNDAIIWDVGHQCYAHKLLTGRSNRFDSIRLKDGLSGFPKRDESPHDFFDTGHASTSISAAVGILAGRALQGNSGKVIAVIGDGALTGGLAFEALSNAGGHSKNLVIVLNDNKMSISKNTGALSHYLTRLTVRQGYQRFRYLFDTSLERIPHIGSKVLAGIRRLKRALKGLFFKTNFFVDFGFQYVGPLSGHNQQELEKVFNDVKKTENPVVIHIQTCKGKGYDYAEYDPSLFHGIGPFNLSDGKVEKSLDTTFSKAFSNSVLNIARNNEAVVAITAAMLTGTGLAPFKHEFPNRCYDVGIAEAHAVTFAAGLATTGMKPVVAIYSTFLQRCVDQIIHDVSIQDLPVVFAIDRAGAVPHDGETHQGLFDISLLRTVPNFSVMCPASEKELGLMLSWAFTQIHPVAIRYPKTVCPKENDEFLAPIVPGQGVFVQKNPKSKILMVCTGGMYKEVKAATDKLAYKEKYADIYNLRFAKPIDINYFLTVVEKYLAVLFVEDGIKLGGISEYLVGIVNKKSPNIETKILAFPDMFYPQGNRSEILEFAGMSTEHIVDSVESFINCSEFNSHSRNENFLKSNY